MASCTNFLSLPFQSREGRALDRTHAPLPDGAVAMFSFGRRLYIIKGRSFSNADLAVTVRWGDETVYLASADGIDTRGGDIRLDLPPGVYDLVKVDPFGGVVQKNIVVKDGAQLIPRSGQPFVQIVYAFPAGQLTTEELEDFIVPYNVRADWAVLDPGSAAYILNKPDFITIEDFNLILSTTIEPIIDAAVGEQLTPIVAEVAGAVSAAEAAAEAATAAAAGITDVRNGTATVITAATTAVAGARLVADTSAGAFAVSLPAAPVQGNHVTVWRSGANAPTVARNGNTIEGLAEDVVLDVDKKGIRLTFLFGTWKAYPAEVML